MKKLLILFAFLIFAFPDPVFATPPASKPRDGLNTKPLLSKFPKTISKPMPLPKGMVPPAHITCMFENKHTYNNIIWTVNCHLTMQFTSQGGKYDCKYLKACRFGFSSALRKGEICYGAVICRLTNPWRNPKPIPDHMEWANQLRKITPPLPKGITPPAHLTCMFEDNKKDIYCHITAQSWRNRGTYNCKSSNGCLAPDVVAVLKPGEGCTTYTIQCIGINPFHTNKSFSPPAIKILSPQKR